MRKLKKLTHSFLFLSLILFSALSCGTSEDEAPETLTVTVSSATVRLGETVSFLATSSYTGDVTAAAVFFVNGEQIEGNSFTPIEENNHNTVYATFNGIQSDVATFASIEDVPSAYTQKVLIEDYTGTWCGYCPRMVTILEYMTDYSDKVIPVAIHTPGAPMDPWTYEFALDMAHPNNYKVLGRPDGRFNRIFPVDMHQNSQGCPNNPSEYYPQVDEFVNQSAPLGLAINSERSGNDLEINVRVGFATDEITDARLVVYLLENGLKHDQVNYFSGGNFTCDPNFDYVNMPDPIPNFPQEHVLLKAYTDVFGDPIPSGEVYDGNIWSRSFNVELPDLVTNPDNLTLVAFVLGNGDTIPTRPVLNTQSAKVGQNQGFD